MQIHLCILLLTLIDLVNVILKGSISKKNICVFGCLWISVSQPSAKMPRSCCDQGHRLSDSRTQLMQKGKSILGCILGFRGWLNSQRRCTLWYRARRLLLLRQMQIQWASQISLAVLEQTNRCCWARFLCVVRLCVCFCEWMNLTVTFDLMCVFSVCLLEQRPFQPV